MKRLVLLLCLLLMLTACAPQPAAPVAPTAAPTPTASPVPTATPAPTMEEALHEYVDSLAPQTLNMFHPFEPIEITPQQFMDEMAAIRALPFEQRTDWFVDHGLCIPQPSEDTDVDWQMETDLWSTYADYRTTAVSEPIPGYKDGMELQWQLAFSDPLNNGGAGRCPYMVLFEKVMDEPWKLVDILYNPDIWSGSRPGHTLLSMRTENTFSLYDPAQRRIILTIPAGELTIEYEGQSVRYVFDNWRWDPYMPLDNLRTADAAAVQLLYECYPSGQIEMEQRLAFGGHAMIFEMENLRPVQVKEMLLPNCDQMVFIDTPIEELLRDDYVCPEYSDARGYTCSESELYLTDERMLTMDWVSVRDEPLRRYWRDHSYPITRLSIRENGELLQIIEIADLARMANEDPETGGGYTDYPDTLRYGEYWCHTDYNLDGWNDLQLYFESSRHELYIGDAFYDTAPDASYILLWNEEEKRFDYWRACEKSIRIDKDARKLTYNNYLSDYNGKHVDVILPDGTIAHESLTLYGRTLDTADVYWQFRQEETYDPPKEYIRQSGKWTEAQP